MSSGLDFRNAAETARRVDPTREWLTRLTAALGDCAWEHLTNNEADLDARVDALIGLAVQWRQGRAG